MHSHEFAPGGDYWAFRLKFTLTVCSGVKRPFKLLTLILINLRYVVNLFLSSFSTFYPLILFLPLTKRTALAVWTPQKLYIPLIKAFHPSPDHLWRYQSPNTINPPQKHRRQLQPPLLSLPPKALFLTKPIHIQTWKKKEARQLCQGHCHCQLLQTDITRQRRLTSNTSVSLVGPAA